MPNKDPMAMTQKQFVVDSGMLAFICGPVLEKENCSLQ